MFAFLAVVCSPPAWSDEVRVPLEGPGLYMSGTGFFAAAPEIVSPGEIRIVYGVVGTLEWVDGALGTVDAFVLLMNGSQRRIHRLDVLVSVFTGRIPRATLSADSVIAPGEKGIQERLFFERRYALHDVEPGTMARVQVSDIDVRNLIANQSRQGYWPVYLRIEASFVDVPEEIPQIQPHISGFLRILPGSLSQRSKNPAPDEEVEEGTAEPTPGP